MSMSEDRDILQQEIARYRAVYEVTRALGGTLDLDRLLSLIMDRTTEVMNADRSSLFLIDWDTSELWSKVAQGVRYRELRFPMDRGLAGAVATSGEILNIPDAYEDPRFNQAIDRQTGYRTSSVLCCPMTNKHGERIGVIQVLNKLTGEPFTRQDEELLCALAGQAAVAIENAQLYEEQKKSFVSFVETLSTAMDARDPITAGHSRRVTAYSVAIGEELGYSEKQLEILRVASLLHDIGKIGVPEVVLFKDGRLDDEEYRIIQSHARHTLNILGKIHFDREKREIPMMAGTHHERIDGKGYPLELAGEDIPEAGRIMAVGDVFDAITSRRHYRDRMDFCKVLNVLTGESGTHFQPEFVDAFMRLKLSRIVAIMESGNPDPVDEADLQRFETMTLAELHAILNGGVEPREVQAEILERFHFNYQRSLPEGYVPMD
jgi:HD-GYP domain-containing protein (c-di-GMP phosphodiesterase class II)